MHLIDFIGLKLKDIGTNSDNHLCLTFNGGHQIILKHKNMNEVQLTKVVKKTASQIKHEKELVKKANADKKAKDKSKQKKKQGPRPLLHHVI